MKTIVLGSTSPRRKEILGFFKIPFIQDSPHFDEEMAPVLEDPAEYAVALAKGKAQSLVGKYPGTLILGADTVVKHRDCYYAKPQNELEAKEFLKQFSGTWQTVVTGLALAIDDQVWTDYELAKVKFTEVTDEIADKYLKSDTWKDKAGGYSIIGSSSLLVEQIEGSFYNVAGLPTAALQRLLLKGNIDLWDHL